MNEQRKAHAAGIQREAYPQQEQHDAPRNEAQARIISDSETYIEQRAAKLRVGGMVERMDSDGNPEYWRVLNANDTAVTLSLGDRRAVMSREEVALEERAAEFGPMIAKHWDKILSITELIPNEKQRVRAVEQLTQYKADIIEMAAFSVADDNPADLEEALHHATKTILQEYKVQQAGAREKSREAALKHAVNVNDGLLRLRTWSMEDSSEHTAIEGADSEDKDVTQVIQQDTPHASPEGTGKIDLKFGKTPNSIASESLSYFKSEAAHLSIDVPRAALAPAHGEISPYAALEILLAADTRQMNVADIDANLGRLNELRDKIDIEGHEEDPARYFAILEIQNQQHALLAQRETMSSESLGTVQQMIQELQTKKPTERKRGRPVDVANLALIMNGHNLTLRSLEHGSSEWSSKTQEVWDIEKRLLAATGHTDELQPENYSALYAFYNAALKNGEMSKADTLAALEDLAEKSNMLSGRDADGLRMLFDELISITPVEATEDNVGESLDDELDAINDVPYISPSASTRRPVPFNALRSDINPQYGQHTPAKSPAETVNFVATYNAKADTRKGPDIMVQGTVEKDARQEPSVTVDKAELRNEPQIDAKYIDRNNAKMLRPDLAPRYLQRDISEDDWEAEGDSEEFDADAAPTGQGSEDNGPLYADVASQNPVTFPEPFRRVSAAFGGPREFRRMYAQLEKAGHAPFDMNALLAAETLPLGQEAKYIAQFSKAAGVPVEKERALTPFAQVAEAFGGDEQFREMYNQLREKGLAPFRIENLEGVDRLKRKTPQDFINAMSNAVKVMEAQEGRIVREPTPFEHIAEELGGEDVLRDMYAALTEDDGKPPYTFAQLKAMKKPTLLQRFMPGIRNPVSKAIDDVRKFMANAEKKGRKTDTFAGRRGGRGSI